MLHLARATPRPVLVLALALLPLALLQPALLPAQPRPAYMSQAAEIIPPRSYDRNRQYPLFVLLPPTGVHASVVSSNFGVAPGLQDQFVLVLPAGEPTRRQYVPDFPGFVDGYEERLLIEIQRAVSDYAVDPQRIYLAGYSLGGDLSWALAVRNPGVFAGAVIAGSRTSHPVTPAALSRLQERGFRAALLIGDREDPARYRGINYARSLLEQAGVQHRYVEYPGGHVIPPTSTLRGAISWVTGVEPQPSRAPDRIAGGSAPEGSGTSTGSPGAAAARGSAAGPLDYRSMDRLALWAELPAELDRDGLTTPTDTSVGLRIEWPWPSFYLRSELEWAGTEATSALVDRRLRQDLIAAGGNRHLLGAGLGWDWLREVDGTRVPRSFELLLMHGMRNPWIIPPGTHDPNRVDSLLLLRYRIPRGVGSGALKALQLANLRAEYTLRIADNWVVDAALAAETVRNTIVDTPAEVPGGLDHRLEWELGLAYRSPSPLLWRVGYRGRRERDLGGGDPAVRGFWHAGVSFSY